MFVFNRVAIIAVILSHNLKCCWAGIMMKDQATADEEEDVSMTEELTINGVKNPSDGIKDLKNDPVVCSLPKEVKKVLEKYYGEL